MDRSRAARGALAAGAAAFLIAVAVASQAPGPRTWALHLPGFLPGPARSFVMGLLAFGAALLAFDFLRAAPTHDPGEAPRVREAASQRGAKRRAAREQSRRSAPGPASRILGWSAWLLLLPWVWLLWKLETRTRFLGDGTVWLQNIQNANPNPFSEPLSAAAWAAYARFLRGSGLPIDAVTAGLLPIFCGLLAAALFWGIACEITPKNGSRVIALAVLATMGLVQLYFGYIESYPTVSVAILAYLWLGLRRARGADHPLWPAIALAVAMACHLSCAFLAPSYLYLLLREKQSWMKRAALALVPPAAAAGLFVLLGYAPSRWLGAFRIAARAVESGHEAALYAKPYATVSLDHAWDVLNAILLALPVPALLLLAAVVSGAARDGKSAPARSGVFGDPAAIFLAAAALPGLLLATSLVLPVAPAQDWDLTSILLLPLAVFGVKAGFSIPRVPMRGARGVGIAVLGAGALLSFVLVNANEDSGLRRYETLVGPGAKITAYARAYGNELLATYDVGRRDYARAVVHAQRALDAEPTNPRYWVKKGAALYQLGRYDEAIPALQEGIRRGPARDDGYYDLGNCLERQKRYAEAAANYREAIRLAEPRPDYFNNLGVALYNLGDADSARVLWTEVVQRWPWYELSRRALTEHFGNAGVGGAKAGGPVSAAPG
jgi:tetratricopeptide (TPR) repeat protein